MPALPRLSGRSSPLSAASALDGAAVLVGLRYPNLALLDRVDGGRGSGRQHLGDAPLGRSSLSDCPTALPTVAAPLPRSVMHAGCFVLARRQPFGLEPLRLRPGTRFNHLQHSRPGPAVRAHSHTLPKPRPL